MSDVVKTAEAAVSDTKAKAEAIGSKIADFFKNTAGQFSAEELLKVLCGAAAVFLAFAFFFTPWVTAEARPYALPLVGTLLGYALGQGIVHNITGQ